MAVDLADLSSLEVAPAIIGRASHWREVDADGRQLLSESGRLSGASLSLMRDSPAGRLRLMVERAQGERRYVGQTNTGTPAETSVALAEAALELGIDHPLGAGWSGTLTVARQHIDRQLRDTALARGYVEHWRWTSWRPGLVWRVDLAPGGELALAGALGWSSHRSLRLELPGRDVARLEPGQGLHRELGLRYQQRLSTGGPWHWSWQAECLWSSTSFSASPVVPVVSSGVLRGGALQPTTRTGATDLRLGLSLHWF